MTQSKKKKSNKPALQLRKPGQISAREAFIAGETVEPLPETSRRSDAQTSESSSIVELRSARAAEPTKASRRRTTIYFEDPIYKQLKVHCAMHDAEMSATVTQAVARWLEEHA